MSHSPSVRILEKHEVITASETLYEAFKHDPMMAWVFGSSEHYEKTAADTFKLWVEYARRYGYAFATENFESVAIRKKPGDMKFNFWRALRSGLIKTPFVMGRESFKRLERIEAEVENATEQYFKDIPFVYCWTMGTHPKYQKKGFGKQLVNKTDELAHEKGVPCILYTASEISKTVHECNGFSVFHQAQIKHSPITLYFMKKEA